MTFFNSGMQARAPKTKGAVRSPSSDEVRPLAYYDLLST